jgi:hypothetical protein
MMTKKVMLTTIDNPHSPFDDFGAWYTWDVIAGYFTASFLARILNTSTHLADLDQESALEWAIDEIIKENVNGVFLKVEREVDTEEEHPDADVFNSF